MGKLKKELRSKDEELLEMKRNVMQWEKKYYDDVERKRSDKEIEEDSKSVKYQIQRITVFSQNRLDSRDLRIRHLEESSDKAERMMEESQNENEKYRSALREQKNKTAALEQKSVV